MAIPTPTVAHDNINAICFRGPPRFEAGLLERTASISNTGRCDARFPDARRPCNKEQIWCRPPKGLVFPVVPHQEHHART